MSAAKVFFSVLLAFVSVGVRAETAPIRSVAVLSLAGNSLALHVQRHQVGSRTESSPVEVRPMEDQVFDQAAIIAARSLLLKLLPNVKLDLMTTQDKGLYGAQNELFEHPEQHVEDRDYLKTLLKEQGVSHAIVISKFRSVAAIKLLDATVGSGALEGLGFYVDDMIDTLNRRDDTRSRGMVAPFAYVRVRLLEADSLNVIGEGTAKQSFILARPSADSSGMDTFNKMTGADKVKNVRTALEYAMEAILPGVLAQ
ncbi:hypothetical protein [Duganella sp. Root198D2]|uniref:hypothetical protein n=1 Tax=Duganella sp. Root198D2 TaxID=1736489 RepID=UPI00070A94B0|nr:hypothetical protein [Duganella sp. Root198D2]KRC03705.1 hypothetical protein ASE26_02410 [Duganella sp. Root198D2]